MVLSKKIVVLLLIIIILLISFIAFFKLSQAHTYGEFATPTSVKPYEGGLYGWPYSAINAKGIFPWHSTGDPLIAIIDTGIDTSNCYFLGSNIHQIILDKQSISSLKVHGTMIAGLITANGNGWSTPQGCVQNANLLSIQAGTDDGATIHQLASAIVQAVAQGSKVINISLGVPSTSIELESAVKYAISKGVIIVAAAGNKNRSYDEYPAAYNGVLSVSSIASNNKIGDNSNFNPNHDIAAPGDFLLTTGPSNSPDRSKQWVSGSSAAVPFVTSLCAIIIHEHKSFSSKEVYDVIFRSAKMMNVNGSTIRVLDVKAALNLADKLDPQVKARGELDIKS